MKQDDMKDIEATLRYLSKIIDKEVTLERNSPGGNSRIWSIKIQQGGGNKYMAWPEMMTGKEVRAVVEHMGRIVDLFRESGIEHQLKVLADFHKVTR